MAGLRRWLGVPENRVRADSPPYDVLLFRAHLWPVRKRCPAIFGPSHFVDPLGTLNALYPKSLPERSPLEISHEVGH
jgi:hypothetical protein